MSVAGLNLVIPDKSDPERDRVADAWVAAGGTVTRLGRFWDPPPLDKRSVRLYGNDTFVLVVAQKLGLEMVSPRDDLLAVLPAELLKRELHIRALGEASALQFPIFIKPLVPKQFRAAVYASHDALCVESQGLEPDALIYVAEVVTFACEARAFVLDGEVLDVELYEGEGSLDGAVELTARAAVTEGVPETCALDVGHIPGRGWAVIEANASWGAGLNGCSAERVIRCMARATFQRSAS